MSHTLQYLRSSSSAPSFLCSFVRPFSTPSGHAHRAARRKWNAWLTCSQSWSLTCRTLAAWMGSFHRVSLRSAWGKHALLLQHGCFMMLKKSLISAWVIDTLFPAVLGLFFLIAHASFLFFRFTFYPFTLLSFTLLISKWFFFPPRKHLCLTHILLAYICIQKHLIAAKIQVLLNVGPIASASFV